MFPNSLWKKWKFCEKNWNSTENDMCLRASFLLAHTAYVRTCISQWSINRAMYLLNKLQTCVPWQWATKQDIQDMQGPGRALGSLVIYSVLLAYM